MGLGIDSSVGPLSVITGATSGLGSALVDVCAREGHYIIGVGRRERELRLLKERALDLGASGVVPVQADLSTIDGRLAVIGAAAKIHNTPRYLFNIAGTYVSDADIEAKPEKGESLFAIKTTAANDLLRAPYWQRFLTGRAFDILPWTSVVYSGSQAQLIELPGSSAYTRVNDVASFNHLIARCNGLVDAKTVYFGNLESATADSFGLSKDDVIPIALAAEEMLTAALDQNLIAAIVLPRAQDTPVAEQVQKRELRVPSYTPEEDPLFMQYKARLHERFSSMSLPKFG